MRGITALVVGLLVAAAPASAEQRIARAFVGDIGFAGRDVAYELREADAFDSESAKVTRRVVRQRPGKPARLVARLGFNTESETGEELSAEFDWDTPGSAVLFARQETHEYPGGPDVFARIAGGTLEQRPHRLADCTETAHVASVAVWDELGAYEDVCGRDTRIVVRQLGDRKAPATFVPVGQEVGRVDIAGDYVASGRSSGLAVYDRRDASLVWSADVNLFRGLDPYRAGAFDLQPEGKVAALLRYRRHHGNGCEVAWFSPAEPQPHVIGRAACHRGGVRMRGDRIAWMAHRRLLSAASRASLA